MPAWREDPADVRPMLASLDEPPVAQRGLVYEPKYDGIRALVDVRPRGETRRRRRRSPSLLAQRQRQDARSSPASSRALAALARTLDGPVLLDGEIVAVDAAGRPLGFQHIQGRIHLTSAGDIARAETSSRPRSSCSTCCATATKTCAACRSRRVVCDCRIASGRARSERALVRLSEIAADDGRADARSARATRAGKD